MNLWQKLTIDWPCAVGDWLWANLVAAPATFLDRLTFRSAARIALQIILLIALLAYFEQIASFDLTYLFAIDANVYLDVFAALFLLVARKHTRQVIQVAARRIWQSLQHYSKMLLRFGARQHCNATRRKKSADGSKQSDDGPAAWGGVGYAFA